MRRSKRSLALAVAIALVALPVAVATASGWSSTTTGGPLAVTSGVLAAPTGPDAAVGTCVKRSSVDVIVTWTPSVSSFADGYAILRATAKAGPYTSVGTAPGGTADSFDDTTTAFNTKYFYEVETTRDAWTSPLTSQVNVKTPRQSCA